MSKRNDDILIDDILESIEKTNKYIDGMDFERFLSDDKTIDAVIRNFEIIGEAANRLADDFKDNTPDIDWHKIRGFRNRIVHDYAGVDLGIVWVIIEDYLPEISQNLRYLRK